MLAGHVGGDVAFGLRRDFHDLFAHPQPGLRRQVARRAHELLAFDERLRQEYRVDEHADVRQHVAVENDVFRVVRAIAHRQTVTPDPPLLQMGGLDDEHVAVPAAGGKAHPGVRRVRPGMRPAVHPDRPRLLVGAAVHLDGDHILGLWILLDPDTKIGRTTQDVRRDVYAALFFWQRDARRIPAVRRLPVGVVDRQPEVVAQLRTGNAFGKVFVIARLPDAGEFNLRRRGARSRKSRGQDSGRGPMARSNHQGVPKEAEGFERYRTERPPARSSCRTPAPITRTRCRPPLRSRQA